MKHDHDLALMDRILTGPGLCKGVGDGKATFCAEQLAGLCTCRSKAGGVA